MSKWNWTGVYTGDERSRKAVHSWFSAWIGDKWGLPLKCEIQEHMDDGREGAMRALYKTPDGQMKELTRKQLARSVKYQISNASPSLLKDYQQEAV